jgi:hypothetical protein
MRGARVCCRAVAVTASTTRRSRTVRRILLGLFGAAAVLGALVLLLLLQLLARDATLYDKDFGQEYVLARAILEGVEPYQPIRDLGARYVGVVSGNFDKPHPTPHPPTVGLLALPLGLMSYPSAARTWFGFELVCLMASVVLLVRGANLPIPLRNAPILAVALVAWPPLTLEFGLGQLMLPLLLALAGAQVALLGGRAAIGGGLLGLTLLIKPIAWPWLIVLAWRRDWLALVAASAVALIGGVVSVVAIGFESAVNYLTHVLPTMSTAFLAEPTNMSLWTVGPRLGSISLGGIPPLAVFVVAAWWSCQRRQLGVSLAMMTVACLLVSPIAWYFYLVLAILPAAYVMAALWRRGLRPPEVAAGLGVFGLMSVSQSLLRELEQGGAGAGIMLEPTLALVLLGVLVAWVTEGKVRTSVPRSTM